MSQPTRVLALLCLRRIAQRLFAGLAVAVFVAPDPSIARSLPPEAIARSIFSDTEAGDWQLKFDIASIEAEAPDVLERAAVIAFVTQLMREVSSQFRTLPENALKFHFAGSDFPEEGSCVFTERSLTKGQFALAARCNRAKRYSVSYRWVGRVTPSELNSDLSIRYRSSSGRSTVRAAALIWYVRIYPCGDPRSPPCVTSGPQQGVSNGIAPHKDAPE